MKKETLAERIDDPLIRIEPGVDAADILARNWNDRLPALVNLDDISWWLRHNGDPDPST